MSLTKEAIAEAKAVKAIAEQSAFDFLKEQFTAEAKGLISQKLREEDDEEETPAPESTPSEIETPAPPAEETPAEEEEDDFDLDEVLRELDSEEEAPLEEVEDEEMEDEEMEDEELDEIIREIESEMPDPSTEDDEEEDYSKMESLRKENLSLKRKLKEATSVISKQRETITEVGLLSAKLLYSNKILGKFNLSEDKKIKVLEAFDRATTLREAKLTYANLIETLNISAKSTKKIVETASKSQKAVTQFKKPVLSEQNEGILNIPKFRLQELAGIIQK